MTNKVISIIVFIHALAIVLLQFIPKTIVLVAGVPTGGVYYYESFIYDFSLLWGMGELWFPAMTVLSFISLFFAFALLIRDRQWSKIAILYTSIPAFLLMLIPITGMIKNPNIFSVVLVIIFILLISENIITAVSIKRRDT